MKLQHYTLNHILLTIATILASTPILMATSLDEEAKWQQVQKLMPPTTLLEQKSSPAIRGLKYGLLASALFGLYKAARSGFDLYQLSRLVTLEKETIRTELDNVEPGAQPAINLIARNTSVIFADLIRRRIISDMGGAEFIFSSGIIGIYNSLPLGIIGGLTLGALFLNTKNSTACQTAIDTAAKKLLNSDPNELPSAITKVITDYKTQKKQNPEQLITAVKAHVEAHFAPIPIKTK